MVTTDSGTMQMTPTRRPALLDRWDSDLEHMQQAALGEPKVVFVRRKGCDILECFS
ncbi:hypothetical protein CCUS01_10221 [Colletotrichum cuscutae]|uniref:Uncharacterized protein n=1 Tax=Colletotrichum cuscutae TaxID=1209917 RepID=A0AAI9UFI3_9PEZI|nr:hypothetical protein CCUS01_10221 [Colletotrichum cuscutae]